MRTPAITYIDETTTAHLATAFEAAFELSHETKVVAAQQWGKGQTTDLELILEVAPEAHTLPVIFRLRIHTDDFSAQAYGRVDAWHASDLVWWNVHSIPGELLATEKKLGYTRDYCEADIEDRLDFYKSDIEELLRVVFRIFRLLPH